MSTGSLRCQKKFNAPSCANSRALRLAPAELNKSTIPIPSHAICLFSVVISRRSFLAPSQRLSNSFPVCFLRVCSKMKLFETIKTAAISYMPNPNRKKDARLRELTGEKVPVFKKATKRLPFYSLYRVRNQLALAFALVGFMFSERIVDIYNAFDRSSRLEAERAKYIAQLDEEDARIDAQDSQATNVSVTT